MCIAILNKSNEIRKSVLKNCWDNNPDGAGIIYSYNDHLYTFKELTSFESFYLKYKGLRRLVKSPIVLHFRIATGSEINEINCHPFEINAKLAFCHNGICDQIRSNKKHSDTYQLNELFKTLPPNFIYNKGINDLIQLTIGNGSKLVFLDNLGKYHILNEQSGHWDKNGNWFSNYTYEYTYFQKYVKPKKKVKTFVSNWYKTGLDNICEICEGENGEYNEYYYGTVCNNCLKEYL